MPREHREFSVDAMGYKGEDVPDEFGLGLGLYAVAFAAGVLVGLLLGLLLLFLR